MHWIYIKSEQIYGFDLDFGLEFSWSPSLTKGLENLSVLVLVSKKKLDFGLGLKTCDLAYIFSFYLSKRQ